ncbi:MAG: hypothetical protein NC082_05625 [Clostridiales bacterium]|nr:hypothetical protein [Clostridiales bacterium]
MKYLKYNFIMLVVAILSIGLSGCSDADPIYVHSDNIITSAACYAGRFSDSPKILADIIEYDKDGNELPEGFTPEQAAGGSGAIVFIVPLDQYSKFDLTNVFVNITGIPYDAVVYPSLTYSRHNILVDEEHPEGLVISVQSGTGSVRKYRIMGIYEQ